MEYTARLTREAGRWLVGFPDCPGCQTFGESKQEALEMAAEALEGWLETSLAYGDVPPRPRTRSGGVPISVPTRLDVAIQLRWLRDKLGLSQAELARRIGVSQQQIAKLEKSSSNPTLRTLVEVTHKLGAHVLIHLGSAPASRKGLLARQSRRSPRSGHARGAPRRQGSV